MQLKGLIAAAVVMLALAGGVYWSNKHPKTDDKPASAKILAIPADQIAELVFQRTGEPATVVKRSGINKWRIEEPKKLEVDPDALRGTLTTLNAMNADRVVEEKASDLSGYGLVNPRFSLTVVTKDKKRTKILLGDATAVGGNVFLKLDNDPRVFTGMATFRSSLDVTWKELRDKRLLAFNQEKISRVELETQAAGKAASIEFGKAATNEWQILKPRTLRADGFQVDDLIRKLRDVKLDASATDEDALKALSSFASATPAGTAKITDPSGVHTIEVRKHKDYGYLAKSSGIEGAYKIGDELPRMFEKTLDDFRNKKLFDFSFSEPSKLEIHDGARQASYQKSAEKWMNGAKAMDSTSVENLVDKLRDVSAAKFSDASFAAPAVEVTVLWEGGKRSEKVQFAKDGEHFLARRENDPAVYQVDSKTVEDIQKAAADIKEEPAKKK